MHCLMDPLVESVVAFFNSLSNHLGYQSMRPDERTTRAILQVLDANDLARLSRRKGEPPTWAATEIFVQEIGSIARQAQPRPVKALPWSKCKYKGPILDKNPTVLDVSVAALFERHRAGCVEWVAVDVALEQLSREALDLMGRYRCCLFQESLAKAARIKCAKHERKYSREGARRRRTLRRQGPGARMARIPIRDTPRKRIGNSGR
jgi:hypothetical protein